MVKAMISSVSYICGDECESVVHMTWECAGYEILSGSIVLCINLLVSTASG